MRALQSVVLAVSTVTLLAVTMSAKHGGENTEPRRNKTTPLLLISLDGYRSDYFYRYQPTLKSMAENGVKAHFMMPSYPTVTFPNHYTIVTVSALWFTCIIDQGNYPCHCFSTFRILMLPAGYLLPLSQCITPVQILST
uniref:Ectonucleotide pyrophosphatase/phosphodiesterase family member 6 n=1 Tax=Scylla olivacea TaxID=85551 RepID=A0A0P4WJE1_SCYOL